MCQICISETCQKGRTVKHVKKAEHDHAENHNLIAFELVDAAVKLKSNLAALNRYIWL